MAKNIVQVFVGIECVGSVFFSSNQVWYAETTDGYGQSFLDRAEAVSELISYVATRDPLLNASVGNA